MTITDLPERLHVATRNDQPYHPQHSWDPHQRDSHAQLAATAAPRVRTRGAIARFAVVGITNTVIDLAVLNLLLWILGATTQSGITLTILVANAVAYTVGAANSYVMNKHWTFRQRRPTTMAEIGRFMATTVLGIAINDLLLWGAGSVLLQVAGATTLFGSSLIWSNTAKLLAIGGSMIVSFLGMRLWVFAHPAQETTIPSGSVANSLADRPDPWAQSRTVDRAERVALSRILAHHSLAIVLPAYNEEGVIAATVSDVLRTLTDWDADFEVIVVNDGSRDRTGAILAELARRDPHVRVVTHPVNLGYGATLVDGFTAATTPTGASGKDLTFFMDSDGQFDIHDLARLLVEVDRFDAVLGYRIQRQDARLRLLNAWGWKQLVRLTLGVHVRDLDCAYKIIRTDFLRTHPLQSQSALINAELLYRLRRAGTTYCQVGVTHLPRQRGQATGANPRVVLRAIRDLIISAWRWRVLGQA